MPARFRHFAINADDTARARAFYEKVFGWTFTPWGPPDFFQVKDAGDGIVGALQARREIGGHTMPGLETTFGVDDIDATVTAIEANGGTIVTPPFQIPSVGKLAFFRDSEGNLAGAMEYAPGVFG